MTRMLRFVPRPRCPTCGAAYSPHTCAGWHRTRQAFGVPLFALLAFLSPAVASGEDFYEYDIRILLSEPVRTCNPAQPPDCSPSAEIRFTVPAWGYVGGAYIKSCEIWAKTHPERWDGVALERDEDITVYGSGLGLGRGLFKVTIGDRRVGRSQLWCLRLPWWPLPEPGEALR